MLDCFVISFLSNNVISSAAKQSMLLKNLKNWIVPSFKTGLLRHFIPRKDMALLERKGGGIPPLRFVGISGIT